MFSEKIIITEIDIAVFVPRGSGSPVHRNRGSHGFAISFHNPVTYTFDTGEVITVNHGECIYLPKGSNYTCHSIAESATGDSGSGTYAINFQRMGSSYTKPILFKPRATEKLFQLFKHTERNWREKTNGFYEECMSSLYIIIKELKKEKNYSSHTKLISVIAPAIKYIDENFTSGTIDIMHLAKLCNISEPYLRRLFNNAFGMSPSVYIRSKRIAYAKELLSSGEYSVTDAAFMSGFNDTSYFSREFKTELGVSPQKYLINLRKP